jgi:TatD DNase family protein
MLIDTHAHLPIDDFNVDREQVIARLEQEKMTVINISTSIADASAVVKMAQQYDWAYATIGVHPTEIFDHPFNEADFVSLLNPKVVAMGEIGLDLWHLDQLKEKFNLSEEEIYKQQLEALDGQLLFAQQHNLAVVIHGRNGQNSEVDVYEVILKKLIDNNIARVVFHCFGGGLTMANKIVAAGYYLGFDGPITFKKNDDLRALVKQIPLANILAETDCPFLAPEPVRGKRNEPMFVKHVIAKIAEIKGLSYPETETILWENAKKLFNIDRTWT